MGNKGKQEGQEVIKADRQDSSQGGRQCLRMWDKARQEGQAGRKSLSRQEGQAGRKSLSRQEHLRMWEPTTKRARRSSATGSTVS